MNTIQRDLQLRKPTKTSNVWILLCDQNQTMISVKAQKKKVIRVRPDIADEWMLHHDNAPCHTALSITEYLTLKGIPVVPQPPYSPDLSPCDFFLLPKLKKCPQKTSFRDFRKHPKVCNWHDEDHTGSGLPAVLPTVRTTSPSVCSCPRGLLWRG